MASVSVQQLVLGVLYFRPLGSDSVINVVSCSPESKHALIIDELFMKTDVTHPGKRKPLLLHLSNMTIMASFLSLVEPSKPNNFSLVSQVISVPGHSLLTDLMT